jgi:hypothetical protein
MYIRDLFFEAPLNRKRAVKLSLMALLVTILGSLLGLEFLVVSLPLSGILARALDVHDYRQREVRRALSEV